MEWRRRWPVKINKLGRRPRVTDLRFIVSAGLQHKAVSGTTAFHTHFDEDIVRVGLNYQFH
jgi:hypothetical protein